MMLKENSGMPPPMISSRPRTPVGNLWSVTLAGPMTFFVDLRLAGSFFISSPYINGQFRPDFGHQPQRQIFADESHQKSEQLGEQYNSTLETPIRACLRLKFLQTFQGAIRFDMHRAEPRNFGVGENERARKEATKPAVAHEHRQMGP